MVTGGAHGIGKAIVAQLCANNTRVIVLDLEPATDCETRVVDLANRDQTLAAAEEALSLLGGCDILINCAGISRMTPLGGFDERKYRQVLAVNLDAPVRLMVKFGNEMAAAGYGRIVNVTSIHGRLSEPGRLAYDVSKAGLEAATRTAATELAADGVLINAVAPGFVATRMSIVNGESQLENAPFRQFYIGHGRLPTKRAALPSEIAAAVTWLASEANSYITGHVLVADGGLSARF